LPRGRNNEIVEGWRGKIEEMETKTGWKMENRIAFGRGDESSKKIERINERELGREGTPKGRRGKGHLKLMEGGWGCKNSKNNTK
jgi:hypothetical protein